MKTQERDWNHIVQSMNEGIERLLFLKLVLCPLISGPRAERRLHPAKKQHPPTELQEVIQHMRNLDLHHLLPDEIP